MLGRPKNTSVALSSTDLTTIYTCPPNFTAIIKEIFLTNVDGSAAVDATLKYTDTSASATFSLLSTTSISADSYLRFNDAFIVLESGDILKAQAGAANDLEVTVFIEEFHRPQG
jgi:fructose-specific component phosphotransferase system IIB-like protein